VVGGSEEDDHESHEKEKVSRRGAENAEGGLAAHRWRDETMEMGAACIPFLSAPLREIFFWFALPSKALYQNQGGVGPSGREVEAGLDVLGHQVWKEDRAETPTG